MANYYVDNSEIYPLADELVEATEALLQKKGIILINDDTDSHQLDKRISVYGEDFRFLRDAIQDILDRRTS